MLLSFHHNHTVLDIFLSRKDGNTSFGLSSAICTRFCQSLRYSFPVVWPHIHELSYSSD